VSVPFSVVSGALKSILGCAVAGALLPGFRGYRAKVKTG